MSTLWSIVAAIVLGVAANVLTPYIKNGFQRGFIGMRKQRAERLEIEVDNAYFFNKYPTWLILYMLKELMNFLILSLFAVMTAVLIFQFAQTRRHWIYPLVTNLCTIGLFNLWTTVNVYYHAQQPKEFETKARTKIAKLIGQPSVELKRKDND